MAASHYHSNVSNTDFVVAELVSRSGWVGHIFTCKDQFIAWMKLQPSNAKMVPCRNARGRQLETIDHRWDFDLDY